MRNKNVQLNVSIRLIILCLAVIIGSAFGGIITAFTSDFINPLINLIGGAEVAGKIVLRDAVMDGELVVAEEVAINWGDFITVLINFLITALILFAILKAVNKLMSIKKKEEMKEEAAPVKSDELKALEEIRDLLKKNK